MNVDSSKEGEWHLVVEGQYEIDAFYLCRCSNGRHAEKWHDEEEIDAHLNALESAARDAEARIRELEAALHRYGTHRMENPEDECGYFLAWNPTPADCNCGFFALLPPSTGEKAAGEVGE